MRQQYKTRISTYIITPIYLATVLFSLVSPMHVRAQEATTPVVPAPVAEEVVAPPDPKYIYNEQTGRWENGTYAWDPTTNTTTPLTQQNYSYNPTTGKWDTTEWAYDNDEQSYTANQQTSPATDIAPSQDTPEISTIPGATLASPAENNSTPPLAAQATSKNLPATVNGVTTEQNNDAYFNGYFDATISVTVNSSAESGDALIVNNTVAGNATSGQAFASASAINMLQSTWGLGMAGQSPQLYNVTIQGGHTGDLVINPNLNTQASQSSAQGLVVNQSNDISIDNQLAVSAQSGNAGVIHNTQAGDATTGDAYALVNLMNLVNSSIGAQESFIAVLNVLGDFEGDVLLPPEMQKQLSNSQGALQMPIGQSTAITNSNQTDIQTAVNAQATSGQATVSHNTIAGNASSGEATTSVTVYNLTGQQILAENAVLVFVNVLGEWVGFITNAPAGSRAAIIGATPTELATSEQNLQATFNNQTTITNTIDVQAQSGNATVDSNMQAGNAATGDAFALANVMNISNSSINMRGWFAVMFINIMGNWHGSFGTDTAYGGFSQTPSGSGGELPGLDNGTINSSTTTDNKKPLVLSSLSDPTKQTTVNTARTRSLRNTSVQPVQSNSTDAPQVLAATENTATTLTTPMQIAKRAFPGYIVLIASITTLGAVLVFRSKGV